MSALWGASRGTGAPGKGRGPSPAGALYGFSVKSVGEADTTHTHRTQKPLGKQTPGWALGAARGRSPLQTVCSCWGQASGRQLSSRVPHGRAGTAPARDSQGARQRRGGRTDFMTQTRGSGLHSCAERGAGQQLRHAWLRGSQTCISPQQGRAVSTGNYRLLRTANRTWGA